MIVLIILWMPVLICMPIILLSYHSHTDKTLLLSLIVIFMALQQLKEYLFMAEAPAKKSNPIYFGVCVWDRTYCELFLNYALASLLAEKNIPTLDNPTGKNCFLISTTKDDWQWFQLQPLFELLQHYMNVKLLEITPISEEAYQKLNHRM